MYALFCPLQNRFFHVTDDAKALKAVQVFLMSKRLLYVCNLTGVRNYKDGMLNNQNCLTVGLQNGKSMTINIDANVASLGYILEVNKSEISTSEKNIKQVVDFLVELFGVYIDYRHRVETDIKNKTNDSLAGMKNFVSIMSMQFPDSKLENLIQPEIDQIERFSSVLDLIFVHISSTIENSNTNITSNDWLNNLKASLLDLPKHNKLVKNFETSLMQLNESN